MTWLLGLFLAFSVPAASATGAHAGPAGLLAPAPPGAVPEPVTQAAGLLYAVVPTSSAGYRVRVHSFFVPETVHGRHGAVSGEIRLAEGVSPTVSGELNIDVSTLRSGVDARDSKVRSILGAADHPSIVFTITGVEPFSVRDLDAAGVTVTAHGSLDVAGVDVALTFPVFARREAGKRLRLDGVARTGFKDLKLKAPGMAFFVMVNDAIDAGADIVADQVPTKRADR